MNAKLREFVIYVLSFMILSSFAISYRMSSSGQPFPMSKILYMYVKKLAEPLASRIIIRAKKDETFKKIICLPPANIYHFYESRKINISAIFVFCL